MKACLFTIAITVMLLCLTGDSLRGAAEAEDPEKECDSKVAELLERIEKLEKRITQVEKCQRMGTVPFQQLKSTAPVVPYEPNATLPRSWRRKEFNGQYYYIVPLDSLGTQASANPRTE